jgi:hypothetical protein
MPSQLTILGEWRKRQVAQMTTRPREDRTNQGTLTVREGSVQLTSL